MIFVFKLQYFLILNSTPKTFTYPLGKLRTEFSSPIAKSTSPGQSDTTFFPTSSLLGLQK